MAETSTYPVSSNRLFFLFSISKRIGSPEILMLAPSKILSLSIVYPPKLELLGIDERYILLMFSFEKYSILETVPPIEDSETVTV